MQKNKYKRSLKKSFILLISALMFSSLGMVGCTQDSTHSNSSEVAISNSIQDLYLNINLEKISSIPVIEMKDLKEISSIGELDDIPVAVKDKGWMIRKDGLYGFIDVAGKVIVEPKYKNILDSSSPAYPNGSIFLYNEDIHSDLIYLPDGSSDATPGVGADVSPQFFIKEDETLIGSTSQELQRNKPFTVFLEGTSYEDRPNSDYYIYFPKFEKVEGPFSSEEQISYFQRSEFLPYGSFNISLEDFFILPATSSRKETYLIDETSNQAIKGFDSVEPADHQTFTALKDDKAYVFYKDLSNGIGYEAESAARNIGEVVPLKIDGSWKLFQSNEESSVAQFINYLSQGENISRHGWGYMGPYLPYQEMDYMVVTKMKFSDTQVDISLCGLKWPNLDLGRYDYEIIPEENENSFSLVVKDVIYKNKMDDLRFQVKLMPGKDLDSSQIIEYSTLVFDTIHNDLFPQGNRQKFDLVSVGESTNSNLKILNSEQNSTSSDKTPSSQETQSEVLADLGLLMETPIKFDNDGWIIKSVDGKYGFVGTNGEIIVEPKYSDLFLMPSVREGNTFGYLYNSEYDWKSDARLPKNYVASEDEVPAGLGWARGDTVFLNEEGEIIYCDGAGEKEIPASTYSGPISDKEEIYTVHSFGIDKENLNFEDYYVYIPKFDYVDGPYAYTHELSFSHKLSKSMDPNGYNRRVGKSIVLVQENDYGLYNLEQNVLLKGFDWIKPLDPNNFGGKTRDNFYVYSTDLNLLYKAEIEEGSAPIGNIAIVKEANTWKVVTLDFLEKNYSPYIDWEPEKISNAIHSKTISVANEGSQLTPGLYRTEVDLKVRSGPSQSYAQVDTKFSNQLIQVTDLKIDDEGLTWGKLWEDRWICLDNQGENYCLKESLNNLEIKDLSSVILDHYNWLLEPEGFYSCVTDFEQNGITWTGIVRYAIGEEEIKRKEEAGVPNIFANIYAFKVEINMETGDISDEKNFDSWNITQ